MSEIIPVFTKALASELASSNVTVNAILPGVIDTPMIRKVYEGVEGGVDAALNAAAKAIPMGRLGDPEEVAEVAGAGDNEQPEELNKWRWLPIKYLENANKDVYNYVTNLDEAYDNETVYGEGARTIPGVLRYFTADLKTLNLILDSCKIKASDRLEPDPTMQVGVTKRARNGGGNPRL